MSRQLWTFGISIPTMTKDKLEICQFIIASHERPTYDELLSYFKQKDQEAETGGFYEYWPVARLIWQTLEMIGDDFKNREGRCEFYGGPIRIDYYLEKSKIIIWDDEKSLSNNDEDISNRYCKLPHDGPEIELKWDDED